MSCEHYFNSKLSASSTACCVPAALGAGASKLTFAVDSADIIVSLFDAAQSMSLMDVQRFCGIGAGPPSHPVRAPCCSENVLRECRLRG